MSEIAKSSTARFDWWVQTKFGVLPTDSRFLDLTEEQKDLMYEHFIIDNPTTKEQPDNSQDRDDYEEALNDADKEAWEEHGVANDYSDTLPLPDPGDSESFADPDFDAEWNAQDEESDSEEVSENESEDGFDPL